jgi:hypothetical protein
MNNNSRSRVKFVKLCKSFTNVPYNDIFRCINVHVSSTTQSERFWDCIERSTADEFGYPAMPLDQACR